MSKATSIFLKLERRISSSESGGVMDRWEYGREVLKAKVGRRQLPDGMIADLIKSAERAGKKISEREIQYRIKLASVYKTDQQVRKAIADLGSWSEIIKAGFPEVTVDVDADAVDDTDVLPNPDEWEQPSLIPGLKRSLKVNGQKIPLMNALVADGEAYEQMCISMHEGFGKTVAQVQESMHYVRLGSNGDRSMNLIEAYQRGLEMQS